MSQSGLFNTRQRYGLVAQTLHWITALLILFLLPLGIYMYQLPISTSEEIADKVWLYSLHKTVGMTALTVAILRIIWALFSKHPEPLHPERKLETFAASAVHWMLYISILLVPVIGFVHHAASVGFAPIWGPFPQEVSFVPKSVELSEYTGLMHFVLAAMMAISIFLHVSGALKHAVIDRDSTLARMIPFASFNDAGQADAGKSEARTPMFAAIAAVIVAFIAAPVIAPLLQTADEAPADTAAQVEGTENAAVANTAQTDTPGGVQTWAVNYAESKLAISIIQMGSPVLGEFSDWSANIAFDPDDLENSRVRVTVNTASLTLGSVSDQAKSADFLDVKTHPQAVFEAEEFTLEGDGYVASGTLTLHGETVPLKLPFLLNIEGDNADMEAAISLNRMDYSVGAKGFADENSVAFAVTVEVMLKATKN